MKAFYVLRGLVWRRQFSFPHGGPRQLLPAARPQAGDCPGVVLRWRGGIPPYIFSGWPAILLQTEATQQEARHTPLTSETGIGDQPTFRFRRSSFLKQSTDGPPGKNCTRRVHRSKSSALALAPHSILSRSISSIQSGRLRTSRGLLPSGGPMIPSRCITSRMRAARP